MKRTLQNISSGLIVSLMVMMIFGSCKKNREPEPGPGKDTTDTTGGATDSSIVASYVFTTSVDTLLFETTAASLEFEVESVGEGATWTIAQGKGIEGMDYSWVTSSVEAGGEGKSMVSISVTENTEELPRMTYFLLKQAKSNKVLRVGVTQYGVVREFTRRSDSSSLVAIFRALNGEKWTAKQGIANRYPWNLRKPMSTWEGVTTDIVDGQLRVVGLTLLANGVEGKQIPAAVYDLRMCRNLEIDGVNIDGGGVSPTIALMSKLRRFVIQNGASIEWIVQPTVSTMGSLEELGLYNVTLDMVSFGRLYGVTTLKSLSLQCGSMRGAMPDGISKLANLEVFKLYSARGVKALAADLSGLTSLKELYIGSGFNITLPSNIGAMSNLEKLSLQLNGATVLPESVKDLTKLKTFVISDTNSVGGVSGNLDVLLAGMPDLEEVLVGGNAFTGSLNWMKGKEQLIKIEVQDNKLSGDINLSENMTANLEILSIWDNAELGGTMSGIGRGTALVTFSADRCSLGGEIPTEIGLCANLGNIYLKNNNIIGNIPIEALTRKTLNGFNVSGNRMSGTLSDYVLTRLKAMRISSLNVCLQQSGYGFTNCTL